MREVDSAARKLGLILGLGDLNARPICRGYANGCECEDCRALERQVSPYFRMWLQRDPDDPKPMPRVFKQTKRAPVQPWDARKAA